MAPVDDEMALSAIERALSLNPSCAMAHYYAARATPAITALFQDVLVWDAFIAVAGLQPLPAPVVRGQTANATVARQRPS
jgi:hypothetical protein